MTLEKYMNHVKEQEALAINRMREILGTSLRLGESAFPQPVEEKIALGPTLSEKYVVSVGNGVYPLQRQTGGGRQAQAWSWGNPLLAGHHCKALQAFNIGGCMYLAAGSSSKIGIVNAQWPEEKKVITFSSADSIHFPVCYGTVNEKLIISRRDKVLAIPLEELVKNNNLQGEKHLLWESEKQVPVDAGVLKGSGLFMGVGRKIFYLDFEIKKAEYAAEVPAGDEIPGNITALAFVDGCLYAGTEWGELYKSERDFHNTYKLALVAQSLTSGIPIGRIQAGAVGSVYFGGSHVYQWSKGRVTPLAKEVKDWHAGREWLFILRERSLELKGADGQVQRIALPPKLEGERRNPQAYCLLVYGGK